MLRVRVFFSYPEMSVNKAPKIQDPVEIIVIDLGSAVP